MVRHYVRKFSYNTYDVKTIANALRTLKKTNKTITDVAKEFNMKIGALAYHWKLHSNKENVDLEENVYKQKYSLRILSRELEQELLSYAISCLDVYSTICSVWIREMAYQLAVEHKVVIPKNWKTDEKAGKDWIVNFKHRHEKTFIEGNLGLKMKNHKCLGNAFNKNYSEVLSKHKLDPKDVFILELCQMKEDYHPDTLPEKSEGGNVKNSTRPKGKSLVTFVGTVSAMGQSIPPYYIFSYTRYHNHQLFKEAPIGSKAKSDPSGTMTKKIFTDYLRHVVENVKCSKTNPVLLLLDDAGYHFSLEAVKIAKENGIVILTFPPSTTDKLQHLEPMKFESVKTEIINEIQIKEKILLFDEEDLDSDFMDYYDIEDFDFDEDLLL